jgi:hypothetical protein
LPARGTASPNVPFAVLAVFFSGTVREALLVAQLDAAEVEHAVLHRAAPSGRGRCGVALIERGDDAEREMQPVPLSPICAPVTSGGPSRKPVVEAEPPAHCATFS